MDKLTKKDIDNRVYDILKQSKSFGVFPTPVRQIVNYSELYLDANTSLHNIPNNYLAKNIGRLQKTLKKVFGALDRRKRIIYIDPTLPVSKRNFVELHEVGHDMLPWQRKTFEYIEDHETINPQTKIEFEAEANYFASASLFQLDTFTDLTANLPLSLKTCVHLSQKFGGSMHATLRRYVEASKRRCALIVLNKAVDITGVLELRDYFQSEKMTKEFGEVPMPKSFDISWPFVQDYITRRRFITDGVITIETASTQANFDYHYFDNSFNVFVLIKPLGEEIKSRTSFHMKGYDK